jgi:hypothetical protein
MEGPSSPRKDAPPIPDPPAPGSAAWLLVLLLLVAGQGYLTLALFGPGDPTGPLLNLQPILTGRHPLHQYHGYLGARSLLARGCMSCYDPAFHAGYPKTPVFDSGSRPAEFLFALVHGDFLPAAYKIGLALFCTSVPLLFWFAARGMGLPRLPSILAAFLGIVLFWQPPCQALLRDGDIDLILAGLLVLAQAGGLIRFHEQPTFLVWLGVVLAGFLAWFAHPVLLAALLLPALVYYFQVGPRHRPSWHLCLVVGLLSAIAANAFWLSDWVGYWWLRVPLRLEGPATPNSLVTALWTAPFWGDMPHRALALALLVLALPALPYLVTRRRRPAACLFGIYITELIVLAILGVTSAPFGAMETSRVFVLALFFAVPLAVVVLHATLGPGCLAVAVASLWLLPIPLPHALRAPTRPLQVGPDTEQAAIIEALRGATTSEARILWEDCPCELNRWTALLPLWTGRPFIGGLDPDPEIEHLTTGLNDQVLAGRALREWSDSQLASYCDRYNVGWVVAWNPETRRRFDSWPAARPLTTFPRAGIEGQLYVIDRRPSFALIGSAELLHADDQRIVLGDVRPWQGVVVLSLHHVAGLKATPARVRVEPEIDPSDPVPRVRLRIDEPVARVTLTWSRR